MIVLEKSAARPSERQGAAGFDAEEKLAFYLRRGFADRKDVFVFNDLRLSLQCAERTERAQIDHLVLHRFGFFIIESKSVFGTVIVNDHLEFRRVFNGEQQGMESPIEQARLQKNLLSQLLADACSKLLKKKIYGIATPRFSDLRFRILVAISDSGIIEREGASPPELMKAEKVVLEIQSAIELHEKTVGVSGFARYLTASKAKGEELMEHRMLPFPDDELAAIRDFLAENHCPQQPASPLCPVCGSHTRRNTAKKGRHAGNDFWGCVNYPKCSGTIDAS